ncbi:hypothetical protein [Saccharopolyspora cebuensis]|uniref:hypothetical protein n=1 Tax=Saccharopolyspora cebuensis TaxID=418759 RepID=UPI0031EC4BA3
MIADDRTLLLDLENLGSVRLRPRPLRARLMTLLAAAGEHHHAVAAYAVAEDGIDSAAAVLAELRIAPLRVAPGPNAAELALLTHARHVHAEGGRTFLVGSADGRFAELTSLGRVELLVWDGQPVATKLAEVAHRVHRLQRPHNSSADDFNATSPPITEVSPAAPPEPPSDRCQPNGIGTHLLTALVTGIATAAGQRLFDAIWPRGRR